MKKIIKLHKQILIATLFLCSFSTMDAQVQRNFWGLELGRSTKEDVKRFLFAKGLEYNNSVGGYDVIEVNGEAELSLGGYKWTPFFRFHNNILYFITLLRFPIDMTSSGEFYDVNTKFIFHDLRSKLNGKYYNLEDPIREKSQTRYARRDTQTVVDMILDDENSLFLNYYDRKLTRAAECGNDL